METNDETAVSTADDAATWIWDPDRLRIVWANEPGLRFWGERSLLELIERDFAPLDEMTHDFAELMHAVVTRESGKVRARLILAPDGVPIRIDARARRVALPDGRPGLQMEAVRAPVGDAAEIDRLREIIERNPTAISLFAEDGALLMQNAAAEQAFGSPELEGLAQRYGDRRAARDALRSLLVNGAHSHAVELTTLVGRRRHRVTMRRMHDPMTGGLAAIVFFTDIADRAPSLMAAAKAEAAAETALLSDLSAGALVFDDAMKVLHLSGSARKILGQVDPKRQASLATLFPDYRHLIAQALTQIRDGISDRADVRLGLDDPERGTRWLRIEMHRGGWRGAAAWLATLTDITEERRVATLAHHAVGDRDRALEALGVGVAVLREDGTVESISPTAAGLIDITEDAIVGRTLNTALDEAGTRALGKALAERSEPLPFIVNRPSEAGERLSPLRVAISPRNPDLGDRRTVVFSETSNGTSDLGTARSEAIARASHELRTPLNAIIGFTQIMLDDPDSVRSDSYRGYLKDINDSGQYMARLVQDMLDLRRIEAGALSLDPAPVDIGDLLRRIARDLEGNAKDRDVTVTVTIQDDLPRVVADAHTLRQAFTNLMGNAVKFTASPGWVRVSAVRRDSGAVQLDVIDNGQGMTPGELERAQEPYAQGRESSRKFGGAGMGLPLAKGFVEANGAEFEILSEKHVGTTTRVSFPARLLKTEAAK